VRQQRQADLLFATKDAALVGIRALVSAAVWFDAHDEQLKAIEKAEKDET
jgi:hypothetical protein